LEGFEGTGINNFTGELPRKKWNKKIDELILFGIVQK